MLLPIIVMADLIAICFVADVITTLYCLLLVFNSKVADVIAILCGWWKTTFYLFVLLADGIAMVADRITTKGGCYLADVRAMVADGIATGQLILVLVLRC